MATMLITEALQQVKILTDRIQKKQRVVTQYATHNSLFVDPLHKVGGSAKTVTEELASISDLEENLVKIRVAIQKKNLEVSLTLEGTTRTIAEWLIWRRDVAPGTSNFKAVLSNSISVARNKLESEVKQATARAVEGQAVKEVNLVVHLDEKALAASSERLGVILGNLDGKLSVFNATTSIEV
jgi:hypothetical protein